MNLFVKFTLTALMVTGGVVLVATAQTPPPAAAPAPAPSVAAPAPPPVAAPAPAATPAVSPDRFEPTDKVRADFDVSFPIDI